MSGNRPDALMQQAIEQWLCFSNMAGADSDKTPLWQGFVVIA